MMPDLGIPPEYHPLLVGVVGSRLYGLDNEDSDTDRHGVYQVTTREVLSLRKVKESWKHETVDTMLYELGHFMDLLRKSNLTALEILWLPEYEVKTLTGGVLINNRDAFAVTKDVEFRAVGAATTKIKEFSDLKKDPKPKQIWHAVRMLDQAAALLRTGEMPTHVGEKRDFYLSLGRLTRDDAIAVLYQRISFVHAAARQSVLRDERDEDLVNDILYSLRTMWAPDALM